MTTQFKEYMVNESTEFSSMENNPLIYTLLIPKVLNADPDTVKKDEQLKAAITATEKFIKDALDKGAVKALVSGFTPYAIMDMFKLSKNKKDTFIKFFQDFKQVACTSSNNFSRCLKIDKKFDELLASPEYMLYMSTL